MSSQSKGYVDTTYLDKAVKEVKGLDSFKQLTGQFSGNREHSCDEKMAD